MNLDQASTLRLRKERRERIEVPQGLPATVSASLKANSIQKKDPQGAQMRLMAKDISFFVPEEPQQLLALFQEIKGLIEQSEVESILLIAGSEQSSIYAKGLQKTIAQFYKLPVKVRGGLLSN